MAQSTDIKGCRMSFLFVVLVICFIIIPELESKHLFRAGKKVENNDGNSHSSAVPRKKDKPKLEYNENTSAKSKNPKPLKKNEKYIDENDESTTLEKNYNKQSNKYTKRRPTKPNSDKDHGRHSDKSADEEIAKPPKTESFNDEYSDESPESKIANQPQPDSDFSEYSVDSDDRHKQKREKSGHESSQLEQYGSHPKESTERRTKISESGKNQSERPGKHSGWQNVSQQHSSKDRSRGSAKRLKNSSSSQSDERMSKSLKSENNGGSSRSTKRSFSSNERNDSSQKSTSKHHGHGSGKELKDASVRSDKSRSINLKSESLGNHLRSSNRAHGKDKHSKSSGTTKSEKVSPETSNNQQAESTVGNTVTDKQLISASSTSVSVPVFTTTSFSKVTTSETSVSNSDSTTKSSAHAIELNPDLEPENEQETSHGLDTEPGIIIKPPYPGRRRCKERTPPCCVSGQLEINLGTINYKARANGILDGVTTEVSDKPQKGYIRCSNSAKIKVAFEPMGNNGCFGCTNGPFCGRRLLQLDLELSRNRRRNTLFHISDSSHKSDGATVHAEFPDVTIYPRHSAENRTTQIRIKGALNARTNKITLFIGNQFIRLINDNRLDENFCDNNMFHINGQIDSENGGMSPNQITIGINRAISSQEDEANFGVCSATLKWACPWQGQEE